MEDREETLEEFGIGNGEWKETGALEKGLQGKDSSKKEGVGRNPRREEFNPYMMVAEVLKELDIEDFSNAQMDLQNSLNESRVEREKLVRKYFTTYVRCRNILENIGDIKTQIDRTKCTEQVQQINILEQILSPILREYKELERKEKQMEFAASHRMLFEGPVLLEEHLNVMDLEAFIQDYLQAKMLADKYRGSKFVSALWARFIKVVSRFKAEISRKIEGSATVSECIHYINAYVKVEPQSAGRMFGTFLTVAKKEFYDHFEKLEKKAAQGVGRPHEALVGHVGSLFASFSFMVKSMRAAEFIYAQEKKMEEFVESGLQALSETAARAVELLFGAYEAKKGAESFFDTELPQMVSSIVAVSKKTEKKLEDEGVDFRGAKGAEKLYGRLFSLLWAHAHLLPQEKIVELLKKTQKLAGAQKTHVQLAKKTLKALVSELPNFPEEKQLKILLSLMYQTVPAIEAQLQEEPAGDSADPAADVFGTLKAEIARKEEEVKSRISANLKKKLQKSKSTEELLMLIVGVRARTGAENAKMRQQTRQIVSVAIAELPLTPLAQYFLQNYLPVRPQEEKPAPPEAQSYRKQFYSLLNL